MGASIVLTGLAMNDPVPGNYLEILFAQGASGGFAGQRPILLIGNPTASGTGTAATVYGPDTPIPCQTENDVINLTGAGSELHRMWRRVSPVAKNTSSIYLVLVAESSGAKATRSYTLLNVPTAAGNLRIYMGDEFVDTAFAASDTLATITANAVTNINAKTNWAVTAAQTTVTTSNDTLTLTAKNKGPRGNWLRGMAVVSFGNGGTPNTTSTNTTDGFFTGGTTADDNTAALATILPNRYYYIASAAEDATQFGAVVTQVNSQALPTTGIRQRAFAGSVDTQSNVDTITTGINAARAEVIWQKNSLWTPAEMAARAAAIYAVEENSGVKPKCNFSSYPRNDSESANWAWPVPRDASAWPTRTVVKTALLNGVTPIAVTQRGNATYLVKRITTKCLNGSNQDFRIRDAHKVTVCDFFADDLIQRENDRLGGKNVTDDFKQGQAPPPDDTTSPARYKELIFGLINAYALGTGSGLLQNVDATKAGVITQRETGSGNPNRMSASIQLFPIDILDQTATQVLQVG